MNNKWAATLADRHDFHRVNVDVGWNRGDPIDNFGNIITGDGLGAFVNIIGLTFVAVHPDNRKFGLGQTRLNVCYPDLCMDQVGEQVAGKLFDKCLAGTVHITARVGIGTGNRSHVDDMAAVSFNHSR